MEVEGVGVGMEVEGLRVEGVGVGIEVQGLRVEGIEGSLEGLRVGRSKM